MQLSEALRRVAVIHQQHSLKAWLAVRRLQQHVDWPDAVWPRLFELIRQEEPIVDGCVLAAQQSPVAVVERRRHWLLKHAVYPQAYFAMQQWFDSEPAEQIFAHYVQAAAEQPSYLHHPLSVLLAFIEGWPLLTDDHQRLLFIERFTELVTSTFYGNNVIRYPLDASYLAPESLSVESLLPICFERPGFWGHNLIALTALSRCAPMISADQQQSFLRQIHEQCYWQFTDADDQWRTSSSPVTSDTDFALTIRRLLFNRAVNIHQITLAEALLTARQISSNDDRSLEAAKRIAAHFA